MTEDAPRGGDSWADGADRWEAAAFAAEQLAVRVVAIRTGIVLSSSEGMAANMREQFAKGFGAIIGSGSQWLPWIHIADEVGLIRLALSDDRISGALNASAPNPVRYRDYAAAMGRATDRPVRLRLPRILLRWALGDVADSVLHNRRMLPHRALQMATASSSQTWTSHWPTYSPTAHLTRRTRPSPLRREGMAAVRPAGNRSNIRTHPTAIHRETWTRSALSKGQPVHGPKMNLTVSNQTSNGESH